MWTAPRAGTAVCSGAAVGRARPIAYSPSLFDFGPNKPPTENTPVGFAGFRLHTPFNRADYFDEVTVFLGASYFRAVGKGQVYGLSARGLSIATADAKGEEFPAFRTFWIEKPTKGATSVVVHALLDSKSAAGAFQRRYASQAIATRKTPSPRREIVMPLQRRRKSRCLSGARRLTREKPPGRSSAS